MAGQLAVGALNLAKALPIITKLGKVTAYGAAGAGGLTGLGAIGSNIAVHTPFLNEMLGQTAKKQAEDRAGKYDRATGKQNRNNMEKFVDTVTGRNLKAVDPDSKGNKSYIQQASNDLVNLNTKTIEARLKKEAEGYDDLQPGTLGDTETLEERKIDIENKRAMAKKADSIVAEGGTLPGTINRRTLAQAEQTSPTSATQVLKRAEADKLDAKLEQLRQDARSDDRYFQEMQMSRQQNANQFAMQMAQQQYQNRRLDMQDARDARTDRMQLIAQIMKGFENVGTAFTY